MSSIAGNWIHTHPSAACLVFSRVGLRQVDDTASLPDLPSDSFARLLLGEHGMLREHVLGWGHYLVTYHTRSGAPCAGVQEESFHCFANKPPAMVRTLWCMLPEIRPE